MSGLIAYIGFIVAFTVVTLILYYGLRAIKFI